MSKTTVSVRELQQNLKRVMARVERGQVIEVLELALAHLAVADDYPEWLLSQKGTVAGDVDLEI